MKRTVRLLLALGAALTAMALLTLGAYAAQGTITSLTAMTNGASDPLSLGAVKWYEDPESGDHYLFLPEAPADGKTTVRFSATAPVSVNGRTLTSGVPTDAFAGGTEFTLRCGDRDYKLFVMRAPGTASVFIRTRDRTMDEVNADKNVRASGSILITDGQGAILYDGALDYIKGRGNSTWLADKKPYNIKLEKKTALFGMEKSKKWCLLANASDVSLIRNTLGYDLARRLGVPYTSGVAAVNLYCNGDFMGAYALTEKVEIASGRVDIYDLEDANEAANELDPEEYPLGGTQNSRKYDAYKWAALPNDPEVIEGGYLLELEKMNRYPDEPAGFVTPHGQPVVVKEPEFASKREVEFIRDYYLAFEEALYAPTGYNAAGRHYTDYLDAQSLARAYVLQEFTENFDGNSSSFYLSLNVDGKLVCGPAWDLDLTFGNGGLNRLIVPGLNNTDPRNFYQLNSHIGFQDDTIPSVLAQAMNHADFRALVREVWETLLVPYYENINETIDRAGALVNASAAMNAIRWRAYGTGDPAEAARIHLTTLDAIKAFAAVRFETLAPLFSGEKHAVRFETSRQSTAFIRDFGVYAPGDAVTLPNASPKPALKHLTLLGWTTDPAGDGPVYPAGSTVTLDDTTTFYAVWGREDGFRDKLTLFLERAKSVLRVILRFFAKTRIRY